MGGHDLPYGKGEAVLVRTEEDVMPVELLGGLMELFEDDGLYEDTVLFADINLSSTDYRGLAEVFSDVYVIAPRDIRIDLDNVYEIGSIGDLTGKGIGLSQCLDGIGDYDAAYITDSVSAPRFYTEDSRLFKYFHILTTQLGSRGVDTYLVDPDGTDERWVSTMKMLVDDELIL